MATLVAEVAQDGLTDQVIWKDGELLSESWATIDLQLYAETRRGERIQWALDTSHFRTRDHLKSPYLTHQLLMDLYGGSAISIVVDDGIEAPEITDDVFPTDDGEA